MTTISGWAIISLTRERKRISLRCHYLRIEIGFCHLVYFGKRDISYEVSHLQLLEKMGETKADKNSKGASIVNRNMYEIGTEGLIEGRTLQK